MGGTLVTAVGVDGVVQDSEKLKVLFLRNGIVLVVVALGTGDGRTHPRGHGGVDAVHNRNVPKFLIIGAAFVVGLGVAVESRGNQLIVCWIWEHVSRQLFDGELVEWHVAVEGTNHPIPVAPYGTRLVICVSGAIGVAGEIQPLSSPVLAIGVGTK